MSSLFSSFLKDERGAQTLEFVLWVPVISVLLVVVVDTTTLYITQTEMESVAHDTARRMTTGHITSEADAEVYAANAMSLRDYPYTVDATYDLDDAMVVTIAVTYDDISIAGFGTYTIFGGDLTARVAMSSPPSLDPFPGSGKKNKGKHLGQLK